MRSTTNAEELKPEQVKEYIAKYGVVCPFCGEQTVEGDAGVEIDAARAYQDVHCTECGKVWTDTYQLDGVI